MHRCRERLTKKKSSFYERDSFDGVKFDSGTYFTFNGECVLGHCLFSPMSCLHVLVQTFLIVLHVCAYMTTGQTLWVILCCLPEKGRREIEKRKRGTGEKEENERK